MNRVCLLSLLFLDLCFIEIWLLASLELCGASLGYLLAIPLISECERALRATNFPSGTHLGCIPVVLAGWTPAFHLSLGNVSCMSCLLLELFFFFFWSYFSLRKNFIYAEKGFVMNKNIFVWMKVTVAAHRKRTKQRWENSPHFSPSNFKSSNILSI